MFAVFYLVGFSYRFGFVNCNILKSLLTQNAPRFAEITYLLKQVRHNENIILVVEGIRVRHIFPMLTKTVSLLSFQIVLNYFYMS